MLCLRFKFRTFITFDFCLLELTFTHKLYVTSTCFTALIFWLLRHLSTSILIPFKSITSFTFWIIVHNWLLSTFDLFWVESCRLFAFEFFIVLTSFATFDFFLYFRSLLRLCRYYGFIQLCCTFDARWLNLRLMNAANRVDIHFVLTGFNWWCFSRRTFLAWLLLGSLYTFVFRLVLLNRSFNWGYLLFRRTGFTLLRGFNWTCLFLRWFDWWRTFSDIFILDWRPDRFILCLFRCFDTLLWFLWGTCQDFFFIADLILLQFSVVSNRPFYLTFMIAFFFAFISVWLFDWFSWLVDHWKIIFIDIFANRFFLASRLHWSLFLLGCLLIF